MKGRKILYRLKSADGFKSEIREADNFMPTIVMAKTMTITCRDYEANCIEAFDPTPKSKTFRMRNHETVEFIEYEEC